MQSETHGKQKQTAYGNLSYRRTPHESPLVLRDMREQKLGFPTTSSGEPFIGCEDYLYEQFLHTYIKYFTLGVLQQRSLISCEDREVEIFFFFPWRLSWGGGSRRQSTSLCLTDLDPAMQCAEVIISSQKYHILECRRKQAASAAFSLLHTLRVRGATVLYSVVTLECPSMVMVMVHRS